VIRIHVTKNNKFKAITTCTIIILPKKLVKNIKDMSIQENNKIKYSDKRTKAKFTLEYSVLYPETSSDSDSLKSKGARCVSANVQTIHKGRNKNMINLCSL